MAPITCRGDSAASAARNFIPGEAGAPAVGLLIAAGLLVMVRRGAAGRAAEVREWYAPRRAANLAPSGALINLDPINQYIAMAPDLLSARDTCRLLGISQA